MCAKRRAASNILFSTEFYSDLELAGMVYGKIVRAPYASGTIADITLPPLPDGYAFFSAKDIPGKKSIKTLGVETPVFCTGRIAYKGEPVGILVGSDAQTLEALSAGVAVQLKPEEPAPATAGGAESAAAGVFAAPAPLAERTVRYGTSDGEAFDALLAGADYLVDGAWNSTLRPIAYGEPCGALAFIKGSSLHVFTATQWISHLRKALSDVTGFDSAKIIITRTPSSDLNTHLLWRATLLAAQAATATLLFGKPVKLMLSRDEQDCYMNKAAPVSILYKTALLKSGEFSAIDCTIDIDVGCYNPFARELVNRCILACCSIYRAKNLRLHAVARSSQKPPFSINLATIDSQVFFAIESQLQFIAERTHFTPLELRLCNSRLPALKHDSFPFRFNCEKVTETLEAVCRASDFLRKYTAYKLDEGDRYKKSFTSPFAPPLRGVALTCAFEGSGFLGTSFSLKHLALEATLTKDGLSIHALPPSNATWQVWRKLAASILELDESKITIDSRFAVEAEPEIPESLSSNMGVMTSLLVKCCRTLKSKKGGELPVTVKKGLTPTLRKSWDKDAFCGTPFLATAFGAAVIELELDPNTYREQLRGIWLVVNGGKILNVRAAEGAIKTAVQQSLAALIEDDPISYPNIRLQFVQSDAPPAPFGELMHSLIPAAFAAALSQALAARIASLPVKTDTMFVISNQAQHALADLLAEQAAANAVASAAEELAAAAAATASTTASGEGSAAAATDASEEGAVAANATPSPATAARAESETAADSASSSPAPGTGADV